MEIICPQCETVLNVPDDQINKKGRCLSCDSKFLIEESLIKKTAASKTIRKDTKKELPTDSVGLNDGFNDKINKSIFALLFASLGVLLGLMMGYFIGKSVGGSNEGDFNESFNPEQSSIIQSKGDTLDPFGIDYD